MQIFVRALSRSGGTLTVTLLDAHPDVAMSYELYPNLLEPQGDPAFEPGTVLGWLSRRRRVVSKLLRREAVPHAGLRRFLSRLDRGGLSIADFRELLQAHLGAGRGFASAEDRLRLVEACAVRKMEREGKKHWGLKCNSSFEDYQAVFPQARFVNVIRDGRDVLASQLHTGSFDPVPEELGRSWAGLHRTFRGLVRAGKLRGYELFYERLAADPEKETRALCEFIGIAYQPAMLGFHAGDLTIYKASHLSMPRISVPVDTRMIGRWRTDLTPAQAEAFCRGAGDAMTEFGYLEPA
jgi:hypothetical protein